MVEGRVAARLALCSRAAVAPDLLDALCKRLASSRDIVVPARVLRLNNGTLSAAAQYDYLKALLDSEASIFLERHGKLLTPEELELFEPLSDDYEVRFYLKALRQKQSPPEYVIKNRCAYDCLFSVTFHRFLQASLVRAHTSRLVLLGTERDPRGSNLSFGLFLVTLRSDSSQYALVYAHRRFAQLKRLLSDGEFFSDSAVKAREPLLFHELLGRYQPQPVSVNTGKLSDNILHQHDELKALTELKQAQQRQAHSESEQEESVEEDEAAWEQADRYDREHCSKSALEHERISDDDLQENREELMRIMQGRFLQGEEQSVNYHEIDHDELGLDDDHADEADRDELDRYLDA